MMRSFLTLTRVDLGFEPKNLLFFEVVWRDSYNFNWQDPASVVNSRTQKNAVTNQVLEGMKSVLGVLSVAECEEEPPLKSDPTDVTVLGRPEPEHGATDEAVSEDYFRTLGIPLVRGRTFSKDDVASARRVMVVNQAFASRYFPREDPLGRKVKLSALDQKYRDAPRDTYFEVVGVVGNYKSRDYENASWQELPEAFIPYSVQVFSWRTFMARTATDPSSALGEMSKVVQSVDPGVAIDTTGTVEASLHKYYRGPQFEFVVMTAFSVIGLTLVLIGIFSVMAYTVAAKTGEIGIRMALGAQRGSIFRMVLGTGSRLIAAGLVIGLCSSYGLTRLLASQIPDISPTDPLTFGCAVFIIVCTGLAACVIPAHRAASVDPLVALRYQ
jgi:putative ABC transport system permease protein